MDASLVKFDPTRYLNREVGEMRARRIEVNRRYRFVEGTTLLEYSLPRLDTFGKKWARGCVEMTCNDVRPDVQINDSQ
jgi:hypothetical protein